LTDPELDELAAATKELTGTSEKMDRADILSEAEARDQNWTEHRSAEAFGRRRVLSAWL
jgi:hypothetical protein